MLAPINARQLILTILKKGGVGAEIGVHEGDFSANLLNATKPQTLYLIDPWLHFTDDGHALSMYGGKNSSQRELDARYDRVRSRFATAIKTGTVRILREKSASAATKIPNQSLNYVYVDGDHTREGVTTDIEHYWPKLMSGGIMAFDDYTLGGWWKDGVVSAVHAMLASRECQIVLAMDTQIAVRKV